MSCNIRERGTSYCLVRSPYRPWNFLRDDFKRSLTYPCPRSLLVSRTAPRKNIYKRDKPWRIGRVVRKKHHRLARMGCCYSGMKSLLYGNWNRHACRKGMCEVDRPYWLTGVNPSRKQKCCSPCHFISFFLLFSASMHIMFSTTFHFVGRFFFLFLQYRLHDFSVSYVSCTFLLSRAQYFLFCCPFFFSFTISCA